MTNFNKAVHDLEKIVTKNVSKYQFPEIKGNTIRIGQILIRPSKNYGYVLINTEQNKTVEVTYSKSGAIAVALAHSKKKNYRTILYYDSIIEKNTNDSEFYFNSINNTDEEFRKQSLINRFEDAGYKITWAKDALDQYILNDIR